MASITLRKGDPFEAILIEMVEMSRAKGHDYAPEPDNTKGLLPTNFDEVAREVPLKDYTPVHGRLHHDDAEAEAHRASSDAGI